jgi:hypothetical protein
VDAVIQLMLTAASDAGSQAEPAEQAEDFFAVADAG